MASPWGRRLRPLAVLCAVLFVLWGAASAASLVCQLLQLDELGWPDENADGEIWTWTLLYLSAAASGCWVALWGLFGLGWRPPLHFGALALLVAVATEIGANQVLVDYLSADWGDLIEGYVDRATLQQPGLSGEAETWGFFIALPLLTAPLPLLVYLVTLFSGAGRKRTGPHQVTVAYQPQYAAPAYVAPPQPVHQPPPQPVHQPPPPVSRPSPQPPPAYRPPEDPPTLRYPTAPPERPYQPYRPVSPDQEDTQPYQPGGS